MSQLRVLDTKYLPSPSPRWVELDAAEAVKSWLRRPRRNLGLFVSVADAAGRAVDARGILRPMNCSTERKL